MRCKEENCSGEINLEMGIAVIVGCAQYASAYPCGICGRLHWPNGNPVFNRSGQQVFLNGGQLEYKDPTKAE
jgi:hypothetical protein